MPALRVDGPFIVYKGWSVAELCGVPDRVREEFLEIIRKAAAPHEEDEE